MPKPTLFQKAFGIPTTTYAGDPAAPLFPDPTSPYSQPNSSKSSLKRPLSIRSTSSRTPSLSGRSTGSKRSVSFDDGASDGGRSYASSVASNDTITSRNSALRQSPRKATSRQYSWQNGQQQQPPLPSPSSSAASLGPSLRSGQQTGNLLNGGTSKSKPSRRYSSEELLQRAAIPYTAPAPPTPAEEAFMASRKRLEQLGTIEPPSLPSSSSTATLRPPSKPAQPARPMALGRSQSLNAATSRAKTPEEIVAALEKAGLLDRVMEVVQEEDEATTPTPTFERESWLDEARRPETIEEEAPTPTQAAPATFETLVEKPMEPQVERREVEAVPIVILPAALPSPPLPLSSVEPMPFAAPLQPFEPPSEATSQPVEAQSEQTSPAPIEARPPTPSPPLSPKRISLIEGREAPSDAFPVVLTSLEIKRKDRGALVGGLVRGFSPPFTLLLRYTSNGWATQEDAEASTSTEGVFEARVVAAKEACRVEMAIRVRDAAGREVWDSNEGRNYVADLPEAMTLSDALSLASSSVREVVRSPIDEVVTTPSAAEFVKSKPSKADALRSILAAPLYAPAAEASTLAPYLQAPPPSSLTSAPSHSNTLERSLPPSPVGSDVSDASYSPSTAVTTPVSSDLGKGTLEPRSKAIPPRMTLTRTESDRERGDTTVDLSFPATPPPLTEQPKRDSPPIPTKSPRRSQMAPPAVTVERAPSWGPNTKRLTGVGPALGAPGKVKRSKSARSTSSASSSRAASPIPFAQPRPLSLADSLPKTRSVAETLAGVPTMNLSDSLPKAPPRVKDMEKSGRTPLPPPLVQPNGAGHTRDISEDSTIDVYADEGLGPYPSQQASRATSISGGSMANEPFTFKRPKSVSSHAYEVEGDSPDQTRAPSPNFMARRRVSSEAMRTGIETASIAPSILSLPARPRTRSLFSESAVSTGGRSDFARSVMSVPTGAYRPTPTRVSAFGNETLTPADPTMCAIAISSNAATSLTKSRYGSTRSHSRLPPAHIAARYGVVSHVSFTEIASPPKKLGKEEVLVQVFAVGVDVWDRARVDTLVERGDGYGYIPGRSFCGKAVECGIDVSRVHKGDFVYGLGDLRKSGAIADLVVVERDRVANAPQGVISIEQIATLPYAGVPAYQAMETLCADLPRGSKILVLNAHVGVGAVAMQLACHLRPARDLWITAQVPITVQDGDAICRAYGASETLRDEPVPVLNALHESSYDAVLDTIGGRRIYDASRRVLHHEGMFVTVVGDELAPSTAKAQWKAGFRSLRRAFIKKDKKAISYICPGLDEREDCRDALDKLREIAERGHLQPVVRRVLPYEDGGEAFGPVPEEGIVLDAAERNDRLEYISTCARDFLLSRYWEEVRLLPWDWKYARRLQRRDALCFEDLLPVINRQSCEDDFGRSDVHQLDVILAAKWVAIRVDETIAHYADESVRLLCDSILIYDLVERVRHAASAQAGPLLPQLSRP